MAPRRLWTQASSTARVNSWGLDISTWPSASRWAASSPNVPKQAFYGQWTKDASGEPLDGSKSKYTFTFPKDQLPPVRFFWSVTMYDLKTRLLVDNPINRYSIGDRTEGLKYNPDGGLTLYVQKDSPGKEKESNWLPAPAGSMSIISRMYGPDDRILKGEFTSFLTPYGKGKASLTMSRYNNRIATVASAALIFSGIQTGVAQQVTEPTPAASPLQEASLPFRTSTIRSNTSGRSRRSCGVSRRWRFIVSAQPHSAILD